jgi:radical SAM superfamily enzyme YgiQ (UPF0313 family)
MEDYDIILIFPKLRAEEIGLPIQPPFGLMAISHRLAGEGYRILIYDQRLESIKDYPGLDLSRLIKKKAPLLVGFSCQTGPCISNALKLSRIVKQIRSDIPVVWGGVHPTLLPDQTLENENIDIVVRGEGEETFYELAKAIENKKALGNVKGILFKDGKNIVRTPERDLIRDLDNVEIPWELVDVDKYIRTIEGKRWLGLITSRGCPYECGFCYHLAFFGKRYWRGWSPDKVISEIKKLLAFGVDAVRFEDDNLMADRKRITAICDRINRGNMNFIWRTATRAQYLSDEFVRIIKNSGCRYCAIGAESGSPELLKLIKKDSTTEDYLNAAKVVKKYKISTTYNWIFGFPMEKRPHINETVSLIKKISGINPDIVHLFNVFSPYPGTELNQTASRFGFKPPSTLEGWNRNFRIECRKLPYVRNKSLIETITWSGSFLALWRRRHFYSRKFRIPMLILGMLGYLRWRFRFFHIPVESIGLKFYFMLNRDET